MSNADLEHAVLALAEGKRAELALKLLDSLNSPGTPVRSDAEWLAAWVPEIERRMRAFRAGTETAEDADQVLADLRSELRGAKRAG